MTRSFAPVFVGLVAAFAGTAWPADGGAHGSHPCWPPGSETVTRSEHARVYVPKVGVTRYGCVYSLGNRVRLGRLEVERPMRIADRFAGFPFRHPANEKAEDFLELRVVDLVSGKVVRRAGAWGDESEVTSDTRVHQLILRKTGGIAWVSTDFPEVGERREPQVWRLDSRGARLLDRGRDIEKRSLHFCGRGKICWMNDGEQKSASLR